jgi:hypothetical protein
MPFMPRGEPQSVPDPDGDAYDEMLRRYRARSTDDAAASDDLLVGSSDADQLIGGSGDDDLGQRFGATMKKGFQDFMAKDANGRPLHPMGHPGLAESIVPVVGSAHEAVADFQEGHPFLAAANVGLAGLELTGVGDVGSDLVKGGIRFGRSQTWNALRKAYGKEGLIDAFQPGHHIIERQHIPGWVPDRVANHWLNIKPMTDRVIDGVEHTGAQVHRRIHGRARVNGQLMPRFTPLQRLQYATKPSTRGLLGVAPETLGRVVGDGLADNLND